MIRITLKAARINKGLTQSDVASIFTERLGRKYTRQAIMTLEKYPSNADYEEAELFSTVYGIPKDNLIFLNDGQLKVIQGAGGVIDA